MLVIQLIRIIADKHRSNVSERSVLGLFSTTQIEVKKIYENFKKRTFKLHFLKDRYINLKNATKLVNRI